MRQFLVVCVGVVALSGCGMDPDGKQALQGMDSAVGIDTADQNPETGVSGTV